MAVLVDVFARIVGVNIEGRISQVCGAEPSYFDAPSSCSGLVVYCAMWLLAFVTVCVLNVHPSKQGAPGSWPPTEGGQTRVIPPSRRCILPPCLRALLFWMVLWVPVYDDFCGLS